MTTLQDSAQKQLRQFVEQIENLESEKKALGADITDKYAEAKGTGFDPKILRKIIAMRKKPSSELQEEEAIMAVYLHALGMSHTEAMSFGEAEKQEAPELVG